MSQDSGDITIAFCLAAVFSACLILAAAILLTGAVGKWGRLLLGISIMAGILQLARLIGVVAQATALTPGNIYQHTVAARVQLAAVIVGLMFVMRCRDDSR